MIIRFSIVDFDEKYVETSKNLIISNYETINEFNIDEDQLEKMQSRSNETRFKKLNDDDTEKLINEVSIHQETMKNVIVKRKRGRSSDNKNKSKIRTKLEIDEYSMMIDVINIFENIIEMQTLITRLNVDSLKFQFYEQVIESH